MAAGATYTPIASTTLGSSQSSVTFSSIGSYTDIDIVVNASQTGGSGDFVGLRLNSDTGTNYSATYLWGTGSAAQSGRFTNQTNGEVGATYPEQGNILIHLMSYANPNIYKPALSRSNSTGYNTGAFVQNWRSTSAVTSITIYIQGGQFAAGSTFTLYGIQAA